MIKIAKELNNVINSLEQMGLEKEASAVHGVFVKLAQEGYTATEFGKGGDAYYASTADDTRTVAQQQAAQFPKVIKAIHKTIKD